MPNTGWPENEQHGLADIDSPALRTGVGMLAVGRRNIA
jgi:hypothetical protein